MNLDARTAIVSLLLSLAGLVAAKDSPIEIRAVANDPGKRPEFYIGTPGKPMARLNLAMEGLTEAQKASPLNGVLYLFDSDQVTAKNAKAHLVASVQVPAGSTRLILIIYPSGDPEPPYRMVAIPDDTKSFPWGSSKVANLTPTEFSLELGALKVALPAGKVTDVKKVTRDGESGNLQTNFSYKEGDQWLVATERRLQYVDNLRRIFVISKQPSSVAPDVRTIQDQNSQEFGR
jgi:hypothetical protein